MTIIDQRGQQVETQYNFVTTLSGQRIPLFKPLQTPHFTNREVELKKLLSEMRPGKIVTYCGPGGIGKTALVTQAIWTLSPDNNSPAYFPDGIIFHTFYNQPNVDVALETIARAFGDEAKPTPEAGAQRVLSGKQVLLVLDGVEEADNLPKIYAIAGGCGVIVTSRNNEDAFDDWADLTPLSTDESIKLLQAWGKQQVDNPETARTICELVGNLPLAVRLVGFYLSHRQANASSYLEWLKTSPLIALDHGKRREQSVPILLKRCLTQLSQDATNTLALVCRLALAPFNSNILSEVFNVPVYEVENRLGQLANWGLLTISDDRYHVTHALIHTYACEYLSLGDATFQKLVNYYLRFTETEKAKGVEGYRHLDQERTHLLYLIEICNKRKCWQSAQELVLALNSYLYVHGKKTEWITVLEVGITAAQNLKDRQSEGNYLGNLGNAYSALGQMKKAIDYYEQALTISRETRHREGESKRLGNLGVVYRALGQVEKAVEYQEQALTISREINDREGEGYRLGNLGLIYGTMGQVEKAIEYHEQALTISREIGDQLSEANHLGNLGFAYDTLGQAEKAIDCCEQALAISREIGHRQGEGNYLDHLGFAYSTLDQVGKAINCYEKALAISREIGNRHVENSVLDKLGSAYNALNQIEKAIDYHEQALALSRAIGYRLGEGSSLGNLGLAYCKLDQVEKAIDHHKQALAISREIGHRLGEGIHLGNLGNAYSALGQAEEAKQCYWDALSILEAIKSPHAERVRLWLDKLG